MVSESLHQEIKLAAVKENKTIIEYIQSMFYVYNQKDNFSM